MTEPGGTPEAKTIEARQLAYDERKLLLDLWAKQEDVAMHFNDLAMRLRLQALAGIGAAALAAGGIFSHQGQLDYLTIGTVLLAGGAVWCGIGLLDVFYYQALLQGAVVSLKKLEAHPQLSEVTLSTDIEAKTGRASRAMRFVFYGIVFALLGGGGGLLVRKGLLVKTSDLPGQTCVRVCASATLATAPVAEPLDAGTGAFDGGASK